MSPSCDITFVHRVRVVLLVFAAVLAATVGEASASELLDRNAGYTSLTVNGSGQASVSWRAGGRTRQVIASGAINARAPQRGCRRSRSASGTAARASSPAAVCATTGRRSRGSSAPARRPTARTGRCRAGSEPSQTTAEVAARLGPRLSHWSGPLPQLEVWTDWAYRRYDHLYGRLTYAGGPVFGFRTSGQGHPLDTYGRNIYVDTYNSRYGSGWHRENGFLAQRPIGVFCYGFYPTARGRLGRERATARP